MRNGGSPDLGGAVEVHWFPEEGAAAPYWMRVQPDRLTGWLVTW